MKQTLTRIAAAAFIGLAVSACASAPAQRPSPPAPAFDANGNAAPALKP
jgi:hypothetical protein